MKMEDLTIEESQVLIRALETKYGSHINHNHPEVTAKEALIASKLRESLLSHVKDELFEHNYGGTNSRVKK